MILEVLLYLHIAAGFTALVSAFIATITKALNTAHKWHIYSGRIFFGGMIIIFLTAAPISIIGRNTFLLLVSIFSFYFAFSGWSYARNRRGTPQAMDWVRSIGMTITSLGMMSYGILMLISGNTFGITMLVFAGIGIVLSIIDIRILRAGGVTGKERISQHLTMMLGGTISTITAFVVVNFTFNPAFVLWLAPTVLITPVIVIWNIKISKGTRPKGMPEAGSSTGSTSS